MFIIFNNGIQFKQKPLVSSINMTKTFPHLEVTFYLVRLARGFALYH